MGVVVGEVVVPDWALTEKATPVKKRRVLENILSRCGLCKGIILGLGVRYISLEASSS